MRGSWGTRLERLPLFGERRALAYAIALGLSAFAWWVRLVLDPAFPPGFPYLTFFPAVILSSVLFGRGPGIVAALVCGALAWFFFIAPENSFAIRPGTLLALIFYAGVVAVDIAVIHWMQRANARLRAERERSRIAGEQLQDLNASLEHLVAERTTELQAHQDQLRQAQKMEAIGQLTGGVAHDFNNLLTVIRGSVDLLRHDRLPVERRARYLDAIGDAADRAAKLTGQLLAFGRRQTLRPETFDVTARLRAITGMLGSVTGNRVRIAGEWPDAPCWVSADISQFETALVNMAVNARDAMGGTGVVTFTVRPGMAMPAIRGHAGGRGPFVAIGIADTGEGIAAEHLDRIFEPFFTTKDVGRGTGLGLSQVFGFAKQSGGDVAVESRPGRTVFTLFLPEAAATAAGPAPAAPAPGPIAAMRVLVVEDNVEVGRFSTQTLRDSGHDTAWATSAEEALDQIAAAAAPFDIVFTDVVMPGMGGLTLARRLRLEMPHLPVVLTSGYSDVLAEEGAHDFVLLHKPYSTDALCRTLADAIEQARVPMETKS